jgi:hypothetical protein
MAVLDVLRRRGAEVRSLVAEGGRLEDLYRELVSADARHTHDELRESTSQQSPGAAQEMR